jgi:hypothetical protein
MVMATEEDRIWILVIDEKTGIGGKIL